MRVGASGVNLNDINITIAFLKLYSFLILVSKKLSFPLKPGSLVKEGKVTIAGVEVLTAAP